MRVAIVGSREYPDLAAVWTFVEKLAARKPDAVIVSGGARGVDTVAAAAGRFFDLEVKEWEPEWDRLGRYYAPIARNTQIVEDCDVLVAFWNGVSTGTKDSLDKARALGKKVRVIKPVGCL